MEQAQSLVSTQDVIKNNAAFYADDSEIRREERRLRHWVIKVLVLTIALLSVSVVGTVLYVFAVKGITIDGTAVGSFLQAMTEIIRFMITPVD